ncbi:tetratricopeptide repeat protein [Morganella morganii]|nr:hypothetical protein [Morganella morganii]
MHLESELGSGRFGFIYSIVSELRNRRVFKINMSNVISKQQLDDRIKKDTGVDIAMLFEQNITLKDYFFFIIFDNISNNTNQETLNFLRNLPNTSIGLSENIYFIYISPARINQFNDISIKLKPLTVTDTNTLIKHKLPQKYISNEDVQKLHDKSEGLVIKLETIIRYLASSSVTEVIESKDIFNDIIIDDDISKTVIKQINNIKNDSNKKETYTLMKILSILNNGESITNIKKTNVGKKITIMDSIQLVESGLASSIDIDSTTTIIKLNPLVKDFIYSKLEDGEIEEISNQFIKIMLNKSKDAIQISSTNKKIIESGYSTDGDNVTSLIINEVMRIKKEDDNEVKENSLNAITYYTRSYLYSLDNASRFKELISSSLRLINVISNGELEYEYHYYLASAYRMLGKDDLVVKHLDIAFELTPKNLKSKISGLTSEYLLHLQKNDNKKAIELAKKTKKEFKANSVAYITAEEILALNESEDKRTKKLVKLEAKARRLKFNTSANNILFHLNEKNISNNKISTMSEIIKTDNSEYNRCRAFIYKMESMVKLGKIDLITDKDITSLSNIYNYLFYQRMDVLFNKCHKVLWAILENKNKFDVIMYIYARGILIWRLNDDFNQEKEYSEKLKSISKNEPLMITLKD